MNIVILDKNTLTMGDLDFSCLDELGDTTYYNVLSPAELPAALQDADAVIINKAQMSRALIESLPRLKYIGLFATGYNNVDLDAADAQGISVVNIPGYSTDAVAQLTFSFILLHAGNVPDYDRAVHQGEWIYAETFSFFPYPISELAGKTLGIVGYGNIGKKVAQIGNAFGMEVLICSRHPDEHCAYEQVSLTDVFRRADYLTLHCPLNSESQDLVNEESLSLMKPTAFLINTSRGGVVDSEALAKALNEGWIAGAGIDVLTEEPMRPDEPLYHARNCILTPHIGWAAIESRKRCIRIAAENLKAWIGGKPQNVVNHPQMDRN